MEGQRGVGEKSRGSLVSDGGGAADLGDREVSMELLRLAQAAAHSTALLLRSPPSVSSLEERRCASLPLLSTQAQSLVGGSSFAMPALISHGASGCSVSGRGWKSAVEVSAIDAAQSFDYESKRLQELEKRNKLKVGIVGFGNFGQFLAERIIKQGHRVLAYSRTDYSEKAKKLGAAFFRSDCHCYVIGASICQLAISVWQILDSDIPNAFESEVQGSKGQLLTKILVVGNFRFFLVVGRHIGQSQCESECKLHSETSDLKIKGFECHSRRTGPRHCQSCDL